MENNTKICGLCLEQLSNDNFERLDVDKIRKLKSLMNLDTSVNERTLICFKCVDVCQESYNFKNACLGKEDYLKTFNRPNDDSKLILEDVIVKTIKSEVKCEEERVCRFCLNYFEVNSLVKINTDENVTFKNMLGRCLPEIEMSIVQNPLICYVCSELLEKLFNFISRYEDTDLFRNLDTKTDVDENISTVSIESDYNINNSVVKIEEIFEDIENPEIQVKSEDFDEDVKDLVNDRSKIWSCEEEEEKPETFRCNMCSFSASNKRDIVKHNRRGHIVRTQVKYSCALCPHQTNRKSSLKLHYRSHQDLTKNGTFRCYKCFYVTERKGSLILHYKRSHEDVSNAPRYKCDECTYETIRSWRLVSHKITHRDPSEIKMYKCAECSHETKRKSSLKKHEKTHARSRENATKPSDKSKETKFVCDVCSFQADKHSRLKRHYLIHMEPSEVNIYKCDYCPFATKWKNNLIMHVIRHKNPSQLPKFKCNECSFETNNKSNLVSHALVHKDPSEVAMFKCKVCPYETKYKRCIQVHEKRHEVDIYVCDECNYKTKFKGCFMKHVRYHKEWKQPANQKQYLNEARQYKCSECSYVGTQKSNLIRHQLLHKDPSERDMHSCKECSYQALYKMSLRRHYKKNHPNLEIPFGDLKTYRCNECEFETSYRKGIVNHLQAHEQEKRRNKVREELQG